MTQEGYCDQTRERMREQQSARWLPRSRHASPNESKKFPGVNRRAPFAPIATSLVSPDTWASGTHDSERTADRLDVAAHDGNAAPGSTGPSTGDDIARHFTVDVDGAKDRDDVTLHALIASRQEPGAAESGRCPPPRRTDRDVIGWWGAAMGRVPGGHRITAR